MGSISLLPPGLSTFFGDYCLTMRCGGVASSLTVPGRRTRAEAARKYATSGMRHAKGFNKKVKKATLTHGDFHRRQLFCSSPTMGLTLSAQLWGSPCLPKCGPGARQPNCGAVFPRPLGADICSQWPNCRAHFLGAANAANLIKPKSLQGRIEAR